MGSKAKLSPQITKPVSTVSQNADTELTVSQSNTNYNDVLLRATVSQAGCHPKTCSTTMLQSFAKGTDLGETSCLLSKILNPTWSAKYFCTRHYGKFVWLQCSIELELCCAMSSVSDQVVSSSDLQWLASCSLGCCRPSIQS